jgi:hypothetical protein
VVDPGEVAFTAQVDDRVGQFFATVWAWDVAAWQGELAPRDPEGKILEAAWMPLHAAKQELSKISWQALTARYLEGDIPRGSFWLRRVDADGWEEWLGSFGAPGRAT